MSEQTALAPHSNFDRIRALARSDEVLSRFAEVLGPSAPTFISSLLVAVQGNDKLMECSPASIVAAGMRAATLRLSCDPALGQAYPVPYYDNRAGCYKAQFQVGYKGMIQLALRTGKYRYLNVAPVYEGQTVVEDQMRGIHNIAGLRASKTVSGYMLYFQLTTGFEKTYYMPVEDILAHAQRYSKTFNQEKGFWKTQTADMMKKTVLLAGLRRWGYFDPSDTMNMTASPEAAEQTEEEFSGIDLDFSDREPLTPNKEAQAMKELGFEPDERAANASEQPADTSLVEEGQALGATITEQPGAMSYETAAAVMGSDKVKYGDKDSEVLSEMSRTISGKLRANGITQTEREQYQFKLDAIKVILAYRAIQPKQDALL